MSDTAINTSGLEGAYDTLHEFIKGAKMRTHPDAWDYLTGGTETETTLRRNRASLDRIALRPSRRGGGCSQEQCRRENSPMSPPATASG